MKLEELYATGDIYLGKDGRKARCDADVSIRKRSEKGKFYYNITFRNKNCEKYIFSKMDRIGRIISADCKRLYFINAGDKSGYKLSNTTKGYNKFASFTDPKLEPFVGDYDLQYDSECGLSYICRTEKR